MTEDRKQEIIDTLQLIADNIDDENLTVFRLVSEYNQQYNNEELVGGRWVRENLPKFSDLE